MGYDAYVICNCYQDGKTIDPPHKEFVRFDEEGLHIEVPDEIYKQDEDMAFQMEHEFRQWLEHACEHHNMEMARERLSNILGWAGFFSVLEEEGGRLKFPVLNEYLPTVNGGILPASLAAAALKELAQLEATKTVNQCKSVLETKSGNQIEPTISEKSFFYQTVSVEPENNWIHGIIDSLKILAEASLKTGNPVHWC